jgi:hypothetical protein
MIAPARYGNRWPLAVHTEMCARSTTRCTRRRSGLSSAAAASVEARARASLRNQRYETVTAAWLDEGATAT